MESFVYYAPTEVIFGRGAEEKTGKAVKNGEGPEFFLFMEEKARKKADFWERSKKNWRKKILYGRVWAE